MTRAFVSLQGALTEDLGYRVHDAIRSVAPGREIRLSIDSCGGKWFAALLIACAIEEHDGIVEVVATEAHSAAGIILAAADVRRIDRRRGAILVHNPQPFTEDGAAEVAGILADYASQAPATVRDWMRSERAFGAAEALAAGLVDSVVDIDGPVPVRLRPTPKRRPSVWLRRAREDFERWDLR